MTNNENLKNNLSDMQYRVVCENGTEPPFNNAYWDNKRAGLYVDIVSGDVLFSSLDKFDSGSGWPSFTRPVDEKSITFIEDRTFGMVRTEVRSSGADSHLGHVFDDGPGPGGKRYCINSAALRFIPVNELEKEGYGRYLSLFSSEDGKKVHEYAVFGGGCFWGMEHLFREIPGVLSTDVGYAGGSTENPTYSEVSSGRTGHAEVVRIEYDPEKVTYDTLLDYFWRMHDPTTLNRQHNDRGTQYRSIILYSSEEQYRTALESRKKFNRKNSFGKDAVTEIKKLDSFYEAEGYHQDYLIKNPNGYMCHILRDDI